MFIDNQMPSLVGAADHMGRDSDRLARQFSGPDGMADKESSRADIQRAAREFEGYFVAYLMKVMRETSVKSGFLENKHGEQFYYFYDQEIGRLAAERGGLGFGTMLLEQYDREHQNIATPDEDNLKSSAVPADNRDEPVKAKGVE